ncbi:hypothetical protein SMICM304S_08521 [Streptomyces microflavus]
MAKHDATYGLGTDPALVEAAWYRMRAAVAAEPAGGKVGGSELEDTFLPGGYYNGYWPYLAEAFAAYVNDQNTEALVEAYENFGATGAGGDNSYSVYTAVQCRDAGWPLALEHLAQRHAPDPRQGALHGLEQHLVQRAVRRLAGWRRSLRCG